MPRTLSTRAWRAVFPCLVAVALCGCSLRTIAVRSTSRLLERGRLAFQAEPDPDFAREAMPGQLKLLEILLRNDPGNRRVLKALAEGFSGYAFLFLEDTDPERAAAAYRRGAGYALRLLERDKRLRGLDRMSPDEMTAALSAAGPEHVPGLYWAATAWAGWANMAKDDPEALVAVPKSVRFMERVLELSPDYEFGGPDLFFGVYYSVRPRLAGGDPAKGWAHFQKALERSERRFLTAQMLAMKYYAAAVLDEDLFRRLAAEIRETPGDALPAARLANEVAKRKSETLLENIDELF